MRSFRHLVSDEPFWIFALLWPLVFFAPVAPGLPKGWLNTLPWRQEFVLALLLVATLALLLRRARESAHFSSWILSSDFRVLLPLILFISWSVISLLWAKSLLNALHYNLTWGAYFICFVLMQRVAAKPRLMRASLASLALVISILGVALAIEFWSTPPDLYQQGLILRRSTGLGEPFAVALPIFAVLAVSLRSRRTSLLCGMASVLAWLAILESLERAPLAGASVGLLLLVGGLFAKKDWRPRRLRRAWLFLIVLVAATAFQTIVPGSSSAFQRFQELKDNDPSARVRLLVWAIGFEMLREHSIGGVGPNNYEFAYPEARAQFSSTHMSSPLVGQQEDLLVQRAHNEYIQIAAELGAVGLALFIIFCAVLIWLSLKALRSARNPLALGAVCSLTTFAISSGASSISFRWLGSGLLFFFAAAITLRFASLNAKNRERFTLTPRAMRSLTVGGLIFASGLACVATVLGISSTLRGMALARLSVSSQQGTSSRSESSEHFFRASLRWNPYDGPTNFDFGAWLYGKRRYREAAQHLRLATENGFNSSTSYAFLAGAQAAAGETTAAEQTLAHSVSVYPRSVFLRVRHAIALAEIGNSPEAEKEFESALLIDSPAARGWRLLMCFGPDAAYMAAKADTSIASPKKLQPESWAYPAIAEQASRPPTAYPEDTESNRIN